MIRITLFALSTFPLWAFATGEKYFDPKDVAKLAGSSREAGDANHKIEALSMGSPDIKNSLYGISESVMPWLIQEAGSDEAKMKLLLEEAKGNPEAFLKRLPASIQSQVSSVARQIETTRNPVKPVP